MQILSEFGYVVSGHVVGHVELYWYLLDGQEVQVEAAVEQVRHVGSQAVQIFVARCPYIPTGQFWQVNVGR